MTNKTGTRSQMTKPIFFLALLALLGAMGLGASAQGSGGEALAPTKAECEQKADAKNFGIHLSERHRFILRCVAGLSH
jgi:hypothetical protein